MKILKYTHWSYSLLIKFWLTMKESNFLYHCLGNCLKQYNDFLSLQTNLLLRICTKPSGWSIYIYSSKSLWRKVVLTSNCSNSRLSNAVSANTIRIETSLTTGENFSWKSITSTREYHFSTNLALYLSILPSYSLLTKLWVTTK